MADPYSFVPATREQVETIRKQLGTDENDIKRAIASVRDWLSKQPHLPNHVDDARIERMYIHCKCSTERVKKGLDAYFSMRTRYPEVLMNRDPKGPDVLSVAEHWKYVLMPRLTKELYRVHIYTDIDPDPKWTNWQHYGKFSSIKMDRLYFEDYSLADILIIDLKNINAGHVVRSDINVIRGMEHSYRHAYCRRLKEIHFINAHKIIDFAMKIVKVALSEKLQERIYVHLPGSTTLFDHVAREDLPNELGGTGGPIDKLSSEFMKYVEEKRDWYLEQDKYTSDESKRPPDNPYMEMFGMEGSFKKLAVD